MTIGLQYFKLHVLLYIVYCGQDKAVARHQNFCSAGGGRGVDLLFLILPFPPPSLSFPFPPLLALYLPPPYPTRRSE